MTTYRQALAIARRICGAEAADVVQDSAAATWRLRDFLHGAPGAYFVRVTQRFAAEAKRGAQRRPLTTDPTIIEALEARRRLGECGRRLPPRLASYIEERM